MYQSPVLYRIAYLFDFEYIFFRFFIWKADGCSPADGAGLCPDEGHAPSAALHPSSFLGFIVLCASLFYGCTFNSKLLADRTHREPIETEAVVAPVVGVPVDAQVGRVVRVVRVERR